ncbi:MAG: hypothetical protein J6X02_05640 [Bacilli bacterium]|nr:hypothetical protein [Bacilli bacterium]
MKKINRINKKLYLIERFTQNNTKVEYTLLANNQMIPFVTLDDLFEDTIVKYKYNDYYLIIYTCNHQSYGMPPVVEAIYDIKNDKIINPVEEYQLTYAIEDMLLYQRKFDVNVIIQAINPEHNLGLCTEDELFELFDYIRGDNIYISDEEAIEYILKTYPILNQYTNLTKPLTVLEYHTLFKDYSSFYFNSMPQNVDYLSNQKKLEKTKNGD